MTQALSDISTQIGSIVDELLQRGYKFPIRVVSVGANGSILAMEYTRDAEGVVHSHCLCEHESRRAKVPMNLLLSDCEGHATLAVLRVDESGKPELVNR